MLIIVEGVDGSGKSTVVDGLLNYMTAEVLHASQPNGTWVDEYVTPLADYQPAQTTAAHRKVGDVLPEAGHKHVVCDRWHWGEIIYGPLYRGVSLLGQAELEYIDAFLVSKGALIVHMWNDEATILERWAERGEDFLQPEHLAQVMNAYHLATRASTVPVLNCRDVDASRLKQIIGIAKSLEESATEMYGPGARA